MKKLSFAFLSIAALSLVTASSALATATVTTPANATISADTVGGTYSNLVGPVLSEGAHDDISVGTIILTAPAGFQFNPAAIVNVVTSRLDAGISPLVTLASSTAVVTSSNITITTTAPDGGTTARTALTWSNIQVRATAVSPLATNTITDATSSTALITGIVKGSTIFGTLSEVAGTAGTKLGFTTAPAATNTAGVAMANVVVQVQGPSGNNVASNNVAITLTLNTGSFASGSTNATTGVGGSATFSNLVINTQGNYTLTASAPATGLSNSPAAPFVIVPGAPGTFQFVQDAPSSILAGTTFPSPVTVQLIDSFGNMISNKTVTLSLLGGGTLSGTTSQASDGTGVATFGGLSVAQAGTNNALVASITSPSMSITGATFTVTAGSATKLGYTTAPAASTPAGVTMASIVVQIQDAAGNSIASNGVPITVTLNTGAFTSGTTTIVTGPGGSATFSDLVINASGNYTLTASSAGNIFTATAPAPFTIATATPSVIQITQDAPTVNTAGVIFSPSVTVHITDSLNNPATNTLVTLSLLGGGSPSGTVSHVTDVTGVATFNNLFISLAGTNYALVANSVNSLSATGNTFTVTAATGSKLVYTSVPAITNVAGSTLSNFVVQVEDPFNNSVAGSGVPITLSLSTSTFASGTTNLTTAPNGSATFSNLVITVAGNNNVIASSAGLTSAIRSMVISPAPFTMTFQQDAPAVTNAGAVFTPSVVVKITDQFNNALTNRPVTMAILNGGTLNGTLSRTTDTNGLATFNNLGINVAGTNYALLASSTNSMSVTGQTFIITTAPASKLIYSVAPPTSSVAGATLTAFTVQIADQFNNSVLTNGIPITMSLSNGTFASGTTLSNSDVNGTASFSDLIITNAGNNRLIASAPGLTSTNKTLVINTATLAITFQQDAPSVTNAGAVFTPSVAVRIADQFSNVLGNASVTLTLLNGGTFNAIGTRTTATNNGVATFTGLNITVPTNNYALVATNAANSLSVTGQTFTITTGAPSKLMYTTIPPSTATAGSTLSAFIVQVEDQFSNPIAGVGVPITLTLNTGSFGSGTTNKVTDSDGSATFIDIVFNTIGTYTMTANSPGLTAAGRIITITPTTASNLAFVQQPPAVTNAGAVFTPAVTVKVTDQFSNPIGSMPVIVSLTGAGTLSGTLSQTTATNGIATFNNLKVNLPGTGDFLTAITTNPALSVNSANFNINVGPIDHYLVSATPPITRGTPFSVTVTAQDVASNTVNDNVTVVTMSGSTGNVQFDANGDSVFGDNMQTLTGGTFTISTLDNIPETASVTATDTNGKTGSTSITVNAAAGDYRSAATGSWNNIATWQTWNGSAWVAASVTPTGGAGTNITIQSTHTVTDNVTLGLTGTLISQGSLIFSGASITVGSGGVVLNSGTINSTASSLIFNSGGTYDHNYTTVAGNIPTAAWNTGSTCAIVGFTTFNGNPVGLGQSFYNFVWNCPNQSTTISLGGALITVNGDFSLVSAGTGTLEGANTAALTLTIAGNMNVQAALVGSVSGTGNTIKIGGNYNQTAGSFSEGSSAIAINFTGANKAFIRSGGTINTVNMGFSVTNAASLSLSNALIISTGQSFTVLVGGTLNCGTNVVSGAGAFTVNSGGSLGIGSTGGIATSGATGNIQTTTRTFSISGVYIYNGLAPQATGSGLPATVSALIVTNTGGTVSLGANVSVTSNLTVTAGIFDLSTFTANRATSGGTLTVANGAALNIGGANPFPSNYATLNLGANSTVVYEGSTQNMSALTYGNLTTSGSGTKTLLAGAASLAGDLNIGTGTTFNAVTNSFSIAGNLTNNGTAFTFSGPQTVTFTGSGTQNVSGASSIAFNTFAIGSNSVIELDNNDSALGFTIAGVAQNGGTWGSTASGAANPDDANFLGLGTLNVTPPTFGMTFLQDAPAVTNAGAVFSPPVMVQLTSSATNLIINKTVTLTLNSGTLNGTLSQLTGTNGVAIFSNLNISVPGTNYSLIATIANPALSATGNTFVVTTAAPSKLVYTTVPAITNIAGSTLSSFVVQVEDQFNNAVPTSGVPITMSLSSGTFASGTTVNNTLSGGSASFVNLVITNAGHNTVIASSPGLTSANDAIVIIPDVANSTISFVVGPTANILAGSTFTNTVQIIDEFNNGVSNATVTLNPNGFATLNGTLSRATTGSGLATFNNLSVNTAGSNYFLTATSGSLSTNSSLFNVLVGGINHYLVTASSPQTRGAPFPVTVTAQDVANNTVPDNSTVVTMSSSTADAQFDANGDSTFGDNTQTLSNGTFTISTLDNIGESVTITAKDVSNRTGSVSITVNAAGGDYRSAQTGPWNTTTTWQIWDGTNWDAAIVPPAGGAGTNITILSTHRVTNNVAVALSGTLITQGSLTFNAGSIAVGSGGLVQNAGTISSTATTLIFNSGGTYQHTQNGGTIPTAAFNSNSLLRVTGITTTVVTLPTSGLSGNVEWNSPNQTLVTGIPLSASTTIGGDFNLVSTGSGSLIGGGTTVRNLSVGGNMNVLGGTYFAIGGNGSSAGNVSVSVAHNLTVSGGNFSMVVGQGTTSSFNVSGALTVGGNLAVNGGTLTILTGTTFASSGISSMTVSGNTSVTAGILDLTDATSGNGVTAALMGNLAISGGTISRAGTLPATVNFDGTSPQNYSKSAGTITGAVNVAILSGATVNFGTSLLDGSSGTFTLNSGGTIGLGDPAGITTSGQTGNIRVTGTRTYNTGASYVYNGSAPQDTGNGLPATVSNLTASNTTATVTLDASVSVTSNLTVSVGTFDLGSFTANRATSGGALAVANGAALNVGGTNSFPSNYTTVNLATNSTVVYEGSAQNVLAQTYGNLTTSGSGTKTLLAGATSLAGELTIGTGTTFNAGTNNFSIAGDWTDNGNGLASSGTQTVTFNGASPQNIDDGTSLTTFNNVTINSNSVLNLAFTGSDNVQFLTIGGVTEPTGTWGATGSGATNIDNTHFQGTTGTLNVLASLTVPSSTTVGTSGSPATYGQPVTFTATVTGTGPVPTGTVTFMDGANTMGTGALNGSAQSLFVTNTLPVGLHLITVVYGGDVNFSGSTSGVLSQQITQANLTVSGITANGKPYDGGITATLNTGGATLVGVIGTDSVTLNTGSAVGVFTDKNVGGSKTVNISGLTISGADSGNYTLTQPSTTASISALNISVTAAANTRVYNALTNAAAIPTVTTGSLQGTDAGNFSELYSDKNVGTGKTLTPSGSVNDGNGGNNYAITFVPANTGVITTLALTVGATGVDKVYDGTTNATVTLSDNRIVGDVFTDSYTTATFADANVGTAKPVSVSGIAIAGTDAGNYTPNTTASTTANITQASLTISADNKTKSLGISNPLLTATYVGFVGGDTTNSLTTQATIVTTAVDNSPIGTYPITVSGAVDTNYSISYNSGTMTVVAMPQLSIVRSGSQVIVTCPATISTQFYQFEYKDNLAAPLWTLLGSAIPGNGSSLSATNMISSQQRFFQVEIMPGQ